MSLDQLDQVILQVYDQTTSPELRRKAIEYLSSIGEPQGGWRTFASKLYETTHPQVAFSCLLAIGDVVARRYLGMLTQERCELRQAVLVMLEQSVTMETPEMFRNKLAHIISYIFRYDYLEWWPNCFGEISSILLIGECTSVVLNEKGNSDELSLLQRPTQVQIGMWLKILKAINEEVIGTRGMGSALIDTAHSNAIKDRMRMGEIATIARLWYQLLVYLYEKQVIQEEVNEILSTIASYVSWIDINLVVNQEYWQMFLKLNVIPEYAVKVLECLYAFLVKGMDRDPRAKWELIHALHLPEILVKSNTMDVRVLSKSAALVNALGMELLSNGRAWREWLEGDGSEEVKGQFENMLEFALENMLKCLNSEEDSIGKMVMDCAHSYIVFLRRLKKKISQWPLGHLKNIGILIEVLHVKMRYGKMYCFERRDTFESEFDTFRKELGRLFRALTQVEPEMVFNYVGHLIVGIDRMEEPLEMEVAVHCLYLLNEGCSDVNQQQAKSSFLLDMIQLLIQSKIFNYEEPRVLVSEFFQCVTRYSKLIGTREELLPLLLNLWTQKHGIVNRDPAMRAIHCSEFTQFVKILKNKMRPYCEEIVIHLKPLVRFSHDSYQYLGFEEQLELFEVMGWLIGQGRDEVEVERYLNILLVPLERDMCEMMNGRLLNHEEHGQKKFYAEWLSSLIRAIGTFSKGFALQVRPGQNKVVGLVQTESEDGCGLHEREGSMKAMEYFIHITDMMVHVVLPLLGEDRESDGIRSAVNFYMQRMATCLKSEWLLPKLRMMYPMLVKPMTMENLNGYILLLIKLMSVYEREDMYELMEVQWSDLLMKMVQVINEVQLNVTRESDEERELQAFKRQYYYFLYVVVHRELTQVMINGINGGKVPDVFGTLEEGCRALNDPMVWKYSLQVLNAMVQQCCGTWMVVNEEDRRLFGEGLLEFLLMRVMPDMFAMVMNEEFKLEDSMNGEVLYEVVNLLRALCVLRMERCEPFLMRYLRESSVMNCSVESARRLLEVLKCGGTVRELRNFFVEFVAYHRGR